MDSSKVFIAGFQNFEIVFLPGTSEVVSHFQPGYSFPWDATACQEAREEASADTGEN